MGTSESNEVSPADVRVGKEGILCTDRGSSIVYVSGRAGLREMNSEH